ncbi:MAG: undecaprenyldiphospho-muramoylpentapeptide beta-N-acetylglucosaminyltransferase [Spirochaetaceae bacterium]|nr:undecaprenyldiphospho-muramoylpentapeptide beta-N-acetylglucosaminyltransferase [Spirochaetaceae bacterium]
MKIALTGGGTAGHVYPLLALAEELKQRGHLNDQPLSFIYIGQKGGVEEQLAEAAGLPFYGITAGKLRRYFSFKNFSDIFRVFKAYKQAKKILKRERPALLFSKGGFVTVPPVIAAAKLGIPVYIHESDSDLGLANRLAARFAKIIFVPYQETKESLKPSFKDKTIVSGNPVRAAMAQGKTDTANQLYNLKENDKVILALGGSSGALQVNNLIAEIAPQLAGKATIIHQMGKNLYKESKQPHYQTFPYINEQLPHLIARADVVVSRAGAGAIWEFAGLQAACIFIPLGMRGDQLRNAKLLEQRGACLILSGEEATADNLLTAINTLLENETQRLALKKAIGGLITINSTAFIADKIIKELQGEAAG